MSRSIAFVSALAVGGLIALQAAANAALSKHISDFGAALISGGITVTVLALLLLVFGHPTQLSGLGGSNRIRDRRDRGRTRCVSGTQGGSPARRRRRGFAPDRRSVGDLSVSRPTGMVRVSGRVVGEGHAGSGREQALRG